MNKILFKPNNPFVLRTNNDYILGVNGGGGWEGGGVPLTRVPDPGGWGGGGGILSLESAVSYNVQLADEITLISIISLIVIFAHAPVLSKLIYTKHAQ